MSINFDISSITAVTPNINYFEFGVDYKRRSISILLHMIYEHKYHDVLSLLVKKAKHGTSARNSYFMIVSGIGNALTYEGFEKEKNAYFENEKLLAVAIKDLEMARIDLITRGES